MKEGSIYKLYCIVLILFVTACAKNEQQTKHPTKSIEPYLDISLTDAERDSLIGGLEDHQKAFEELHKFHLDNSVGMALDFNPLPQGFEINKNQKSIIRCLSQFELPISTQFFNSDKDEILKLQDGGFIIIQDGQVSLANIGIGILDYWESQKTNKTNSSNLVFNTEESKQQKIDKSNQLSE